jgi:hypothetical protein
VHRRHRPHRDKTDYKWFWSAKTCFRDKLKTDETLKQCHALHRESLASQSV